MLLLYSLLFLSFFLDHLYLQLTMRMSTLSLLASSATAGTVHPSVEDQESSSNTPHNSIFSKHLSSSGFKWPTFHRSNGGQTVCVSGFVPVTASTEDNIKLDLSLPKNQMEVTEFFVASYSVGSTVARDINKGKASVLGTWDIYATLCTPEQNVKPKGVQFLTHGVGVGLPVRIPGRIVLTFCSLITHTGTLHQTTATSMSLLSMAMHLSSTIAWVSVNPQNPIPSRSSKLLSKSRSLESWLIASGRVNLAVSSSRRLWVRATHSAALSQTPSPSNTPTPSMRPFSLAFLPTFRTSPCFCKP
jgi:hypothetical protein